MKRINHDGPPAEDRVAFEAWLRSETHFIEMCDLSGELATYDGGYDDTVIHAAWLAWNARGEKCR